MAEVPEDIAKLLDSEERVLLYLRQKKFRPAVNVESVAITSKRVILRKPAMMRIKKSFIDYSYADMLNVIMDKGPLRSTLMLNMRMDGDDLIIEDIPNEMAQQAFRIIRDAVNQARRQSATE